jgi:hypothetical protein
MKDASKCKVRAREEVVNSRSVWRWSGPRTRRTLNGKSFRCIRLVSIHDSIPGKGSDEMKAITPFFLLSVLGLSACQAASRLAGTSWKLILYGDLINPQPVLPAESPTLKFQSNERFVAQTGCYSAGGNYEEAAYVEGPRNSF